MRAQAGCQVTICPTSTPLGISPALPRLTGAQFNRSVLVPAQPESARIRHMLKSAKTLLLLALAPAVFGAVKLPSLISDHMVLQQGMPVRIWGSADSGESVRVEFQGQNVSVKARENGKWEAWLKPLAAAGPLEMTIAASNRIVIRDVLVGEVWLGSGQSNMEFVLSNAVNHDDEIARADYPLMHLFHVKRLVAE